MGCSSIKIFANWKPIGAFMSNFLNGDFEFCVNKVNWGEEGCHIFNELNFSWHLGKIIPLDSSEGKGLDDPVGHRKMTSAYDSKGQVKDVSQI